MKKTLLAVFILLSLHRAGAYCESDHSGISIILEYLGATMVDGLNVEYSPNGNLDIGLGYMASKFPMPLEMHSYIRYDLLDTPISPFLEASSLLMLWETGNNGIGPLFARLHAGVVARFENGLVMGLSVGYQVFGSDKILVMNSGRFFPGAFIGWKFKSR